MIYNRDKMSDIKKIISKLNKSDYSDFEFSNLFIANIKYDENHNPIAFCTAKRPKPEEAIISIAVIPECRGQGIARSLAKKTISEVSKNDKITKIYWGAYSDNTASISLAKSLGFKFKCSYDDGKIVIYMKKSKKEDK